MVNKLTEIGRLIQEYNKINTRLKQEYYNMQF